jgi:hypothetical protein
MEYLTQLLLVRAGRLVQAEQLKALMGKTLCLQASLQLEGVEAEVTTQVLLMVQMVVLAEVVLLVIMKMA